MLFILHQVNCQNAFGAGFAGYLTKHASHVKQDYHKFVTNLASQGVKNASLLGQYCLSQYDDKVAILHVFAQCYYGNSRKTGKCYTDYKALEFALSNIRTNHPDDTIICPQFIGCGLAGGDWNIVSKILAKYSITPCDKIDLENRVYHIAK